MTNTMNNTQVKGFYVNAYYADGSVYSTEYCRTQAKAEAKAERIAKLFAKRHPEHRVEVSKTRAK